MGTWALPRSGTLSCNSAINFGGSGDEEGVYSIGTDSKSQGHSTCKNGSRKALEGGVVLVRICLSPRFRHAFAYFTCDPEVTQIKALFKEDPGCPVPTPKSTSIGARTSDHCRSTCGTVAVSVDRSDRSDPLVHGGALGCLGVFIWLMSPRPRGNQCFIGRRIHQVKRLRTTLA